jgi:mycothiol system anti-sigma-R factor
MNCRDCMDKLDSYVDRELTDEELEDVRHHLKLCPPCEVLFNLRADLKRLVRVSCHEVKADPSLHAKVRNLFG